MDNCIVRNCKKCGHETVHEVDKRSLDGSCYGYNGRGEDETLKEYNKRVDSLQKVMDERRKKSTIETYKCLSCGKVWVDVKTVDYIGNYKYKARNHTYEDKSPYGDTIYLKGYN